MAAAIDPSIITHQDVVFAEATPEQRTSTWRINGASWAKPMALDDYISGENKLFATALIGNGGCKFWLLHRRDDPNEIICSMEATRKPVLVASGGKTRSEHAYAIASVFTNPVYRNKGMAALLLRKAQEAIDATGAICSVLYSDIGKAYYARLGWTVHPSKQVSLSLVEGSNVTPLERSPDGQYLTRGEMPSLCDLDLRLLTQKFKQLGEHDDGKTHVAFAPSTEQIEWHVTRDVYKAPLLAGREVIHHGAMIGNNWLYWEHDYRKNKLQILRIVTAEGATPEEKSTAIASLLQMALLEAKDWNLPRILVWNPDEHVTAAAKKLGTILSEAVTIVFDEREDGSLPSLRWCPSEPLKGEIVWEENFYYAWC
jgi:GNAT superfamily N-acetyltransferase